MDAPTTADIREWSHAEFDSLEYPEPTGNDEDTLQLLLDRSIEYVLSVTGRTLDSIPTDLVNTAQEAIQRRVEQLTIKQAARGGRRPQATST